MKKEDALKNLETWLDLAAHSVIFGKYDRLCDEAYKVLGDKEYSLIYKRWSSGYVTCSDGYARRR